MSRPAVFLDRDGTLIEEVDYLADPDAVVLLPTVPEALRSLAAAGYALVVVTNQSGVARGLLDLDTLRAIHARLEVLLAEHDVRLDHIDACPHHPDHGPPEFRRSCECRKPAPGMLLDAAQTLDLDLERSWMVGDAERDVESGLRAGARGVLIATGKGRRERARLEAEGRPPEHFVEDLAGFAQLVLSNP